MHFSLQSLKPAKQVGVNLLQALYTARIQTVQQATLKQRICLLATLTINRVVVVSKPVEKYIGSIVRIVFGQCLYVFIVKSIGISFFAIGSLELEVVSDAHELNAIGYQFLFKPTPIVTSLGIICFIIDCTNYINSRELLFGMFFIPSSPHLAIIIEPNGYFDIAIYFNIRCL